MLKAKTYNARRPITTVRSNTNRPQRTFNSYVAVALSAVLAGYVIYALFTLVFSHGGLVRTRAWGAFSAHQQLSFLLVCYNIYLSAAIVALTIKNLVFKKLGPLADFVILLSLLMSGGLLALLYSYQPLLLVVSLSAQLVLLLLAKLLFRNYSFAGVNFYLTSQLMVGIGLAWGAWFLLALHISLMTKLILIGTAPLLLITLPSDFLQMFELYDIVCRENWRRPKQPFPQRIYNHEPMVSIHVPAYNEPPDLVIETLIKLSELDYSNYEVIVIDNNTKDPQLWMPVQAYCERLGDKFRFFHVDELEGAKGGALNYALTLTDPKASVVAVMDSDYHADPDFLRALVGHFDNSKIGFVQTPHDYRDWQGNLFLTMCYWEYKIFFHSAMVSLSERDAGITVGTMCLIRKEALQKAGGWSQWCVTEDSELAIRIHDVGYSSVYVDTTYGRGLIPDTFEGYKKQRYRWTAGPVQEFRHHIKHFIGLSKKPSKFSFIQRIFHLNHGLDNILLGFDLPLMFVGILLIVSMIVHHEIIAVPFEMWLAATVMFVTSPVLTLLMYKATIKPTFWEIIGQLFAGKSLSHVIHYAAFRTSLTGNAVWNRTNKFKAKHSYAAALYAAKEEIVAGLILSAFVIGAFTLFPYTGLSLMLLIGLSYSCLTYFTSPIMAMISVWSAKRLAGDEPDTDNAQMLFRTAVFDEAVPLSVAAERY